MTRYLLICMDGLDGRALSDAFAAGRLGRFRALVAGGVRFSLSGVEPLQAHASATSLATGRYPHEHGVLDFSTLVGNAVRPASSAMTAGTNVWDIAARAGLRAHVIGWPGTQPARWAGGVTISDRFLTPPPASPDADWPLPEDCIAPSDGRDALAETRLRPDEVPADAIRTFVPLAARVDQTRDPRLAELAVILARVISLHAATLWALTERPWDLAACHYPGIDLAARTFARYAPPQMASVSDRDHAIYGGVCDAMLGFHDALLTALCEAVGPETTILLVSGYGYHAGLARPEHVPADAAGNEAQRSPGGLVIAHGPGVAREHPPVGASLLDVAPSILRALGTEPPASMGGQAWEMLAAHAPAPTRVPARHIPEPVADPPPTDDATPAMRRDLAHARARSLRHARQYDAAIAGLRALADEKPEDLAVATSLARTYYEAGDVEALRACVEAMVARGVDTPLAHVTMAGLAFSRRDMGAVRTHLARADAFDHQDANIIALSGQVEARLQDWPQARARFERALALQPHNTTALDGLALVCLAEGDFESSAEWARRALEHASHLPMPHYRLGIALHRLGQVDAAIDALGRAARIAPTLVAAHRRLAEIHRHDRSDIARAVQHEVAARAALRAKSRPR